MRKTVIYVNCLMFLSVGAAFASASLTASVTGQVSNPAVGVNVTLTVTGSDRFTVVLGSTLATSTITPASGATISIMPNGNVSRFGVTSNGTIAPAANFLGMTFATPSPTLSVRNSSVDATGSGNPSSPIGTTAFNIGALSSTVLTITAGGGNGVEIRKRANGTTTFAFSSTAAIPLTAYPTDEYALTPTGNSFVTIPITLTALPG